MKLLKTTFFLLKESFTEFSNDNGMKLSAALSYYTIFSLAPMLLVIISVLSFFVDETTIQSELFAQIRGLVGESATDSLQEIIKNAKVSDKTGVAAMIGVVTLLIGATGVFAEMQDSINFIWSIKVKPKRGWVKYLTNRLLSFSLILALGFLLVVSLGVSAIVQILSRQLEQYFSELSVAVFYVLNTAIMLAVITSLFMVVFKVLPDGKLRWKECMVGAIFTSLLFMIGKFLIGYYLGSLNLGATYGASASIVILLTWIYYSSIILYFGAEFTKVFARLDGIAIAPSKHAVLIERKEINREES